MFPGLAIEQVAMRVGGQLLVGGEAGVSRGSHMGGQSHIADSQRVAEGGQGLRGPKETRSKPCAPLVGCDLRPAPQCPKSLVYTNRANFTSLKG